MEIYQDKLNQLINCKINSQKKIVNDFYSCGGFNTPTLCVVAKGIKARLQPPYENNIPRLC